MLHTDAEVDTNLIVVVYIHTKWTYMHFLALSAERVQEHWQASNSEPILDPRLGF
jgi:heme O synthase-like polyprenyltransferase